MNNLRITATQLARNLSSLLSEVRYRNVSLEIWRGKEMVALIKPPSPDPVGYPIERLNDLLARVPPLESDDAQAFLDDLDALDTTVGAHRDPWES